MKIIDCSFDKNGFGFMVLMCKTQDDLWHLYNIVRTGDLVKAMTKRKVDCSGRDKGSGKPIRVSTTAHIKVTSVDFDPAYSGIRINGITINSTEYLSAGVHHTLEIKLHTQFRLTKGSWDSIDIQRIEKTISNKFNNFETMAAVVLHEGVAQICHLTHDMTIVKAKVQMQVARKRSGFGISHEKSLKDFLETVAKTFLRHIQVDDMKAVIVAGRGFLHNNFLKVLYEIADELNQPFNKKQKEKFVLVSVSSGYKHSLKELLLNPATSALLADTTAQEEIKALNKFMDLIHNNASRAFYGYKHVVMANEHCAIDTLMVSDALFRSNDLEKRKSYVKLVEETQKNNGKVLIFSSLHISGEQLNQLTGVAAILRYPLPELEDEDMDDEEGETQDVPINGFQYKVDEVKVEEIQQVHLA